MTKKIAAPITPVDPPRAFKRVLAISDTHCGHLVGLTPPRWIANSEKFRHQRQKQWEWFSGLIEAMQPIDLLIHAGDAITGREPKSGGKDCLVADRNDQVDMAVDVIKFINPKNLLMCFGTAYHTGQEEDWESTLFSRLREGNVVSGESKLGAHETADVNGLIFDVKHKIGSSAIPHGRFTSLARTALWNMHWASRKQRPRGNVFLRGHVHYCCECGTPGDGWKTMTLPALQGMGSVYGARECEGTVDFGMAVFDVESARVWTHSVLLLDPAEFPATVMKV